MPRKRIDKPGARLGIPSLCCVLGILASVVFSFGQQTYPGNTMAYSKAMPVTSTSVKKTPTTEQPKRESFISATHKKTSLWADPTQQTPELFPVTKQAESSTVFATSADGMLLAKSESISSTKNPLEKFTTHSWKTVSSAEAFGISPRSMSGLNSSSPGSNQPAMQKNKKKKKKKKQKCKPKLRSTTGLVGRVEWTSAENECRPSMTWKVSVPQDYGLTFKLHDLKLHDNMYDLKYKNSCPETAYLTDANFSSDSISGISYYPKIFNLTDMNIVIITSAQNSVNGVRHLNISFYAHEVNSFPRLARNNFPHRMNDSTESFEEYDCAEKHVQIPEVFKCDRIKQCIDGEDEADCSYTHVGCGDWVPYKDTCLKIEFPSVQSSGDGHVTTPNQAEEACRFNHNAQLASLLDEDGMNLVTNMVRRSGFSNITVGLKKFRPASLKLEHLYRYTWQWGGKGGPIEYNYQQLQREIDAPLLGCAMLVVSFYTHYDPLDCGFPETEPNGYVCMKQNSLISAQDPRVSSIIFSPAQSETVNKVRIKECSDGSIVHDFHPCRWGNWQQRSEKPQGNFPMFQCRLGPAVHYTQVCDGLADCVDGSDESMCTKPRFSPLKDDHFVCEKFQLVNSFQRCNNVQDCFDGSDEDFCSSCNYGVFCEGVGCVYLEFVQFFEVCPGDRLNQYVYPIDTINDSPIPTEVYLDGFGMSRPTSTKENCSDTTFRCHSGLCIPSYMINNGEKDCPYGEDEDIPWENVTCPGYYRCHEYGLCLHPDLLCNGVYECPNKDDERYCNLPCPDNCTCEGFAYSCSDTFDLRDYLGVRYLDVSETHISDMFLQELYVMEYLLFLNLSNCQLRSVTIHEMPQLIILDLSYNLLKALSSLNLRDLSGLTWLDLSHNPLVHLLDLSFSDFLKLASLTNLETLLLTNTEVTSISNRALSPLSKLINLDLSDNKLTTYGSDIFVGVSSLQVLYSDDGKMCCEYFHRHSLDMCYAPVDELSSCSDLLRSDFFRVFLWTLSVLSIAGNAGVLVYRTIADERSTSLPFRLLVKNLCASDLLMGVYLMMIGVADELFRGQYVEKEREWRHSAWCTAAGFLAFVSSEASALVICCITLDRLLVLCYPLKASLHLKAKSVIALCCCVWCTCLVLATVPLMAGLEFYGQNGICLPLPITRQQFSGQFYAFAVFIVFNFVLFVLIGVGQLVIYTAVRRTGAATGSKRRQQDTTIARRLFLVVFTDFCCWFPVGLIGLLAFSGVPIPGVVNVWIAIFVLPLNSALNPFLYTLNTLLEQMEKKWIEARTARMVSKLNTEINNLQPNDVEEIARVCIRSKLIKQERFLRLMGLNEDELNLLEKPSRDNGNASSMCKTAGSVAASDVSSSAAIDMK